MNVVSKTLSDGRECIHWFIRDEKGPITTPTGAKMSILGPIRIGGATGRIACHPDQNTILPQQRGGDVFINRNTDDPRAATCPECRAVPEFAEKMKELGELVKG